MKTNLYQTIVQAAFPYKKRRNYLQKNRKNNLNQKSKKTSPPKKSAQNHDKKHGKIQN